jgi:membrane protease YdiL (CAAX protease family)
LTPDNQYNLPVSVFIIPLLAILILPGIAAGGIGSRLAFFFAELLIGLPCLIHTPALLRKSVWPLGFEFSSETLKIMLAGLLLIPVIQFTPALVELIVPIPQEMQERILESIQADGLVQNAISYTTVVLVAPIMEEVFFRGAVIWAWDRGLGRHLIIVGPAFIFSVIHMNPWLFPGLFILGLYLGYLRIKSSSLMPGIVIHAINNLLALLLLLQTN